MTDLERRMAWPGAKDAILQASWVEVADWPDALTPDQIGALHARKDDGSSNRAVRDELASFLQDEIDQGRIDAVTVTQVSSRDMGIISWDEAKPPVTFEAQAIAVGTCARLLAGVEVGKYLAAWISPCRQHDESTKPKGDDFDSPGAVLERILAECEKRATAAGERFDVNDMPGQIAQFWGLCQQLEVVFKRQTSIESFKRYTKVGRCKWSRSAKANADATPLYQKLFPEAWRNDGAVSEKSLVA